MLQVSRKVTVLMHEEFSCHCENGSYQIQGINFFQSYSPVAHVDYSRINIDIADIHRLADRILDVINIFQNKNVPINEILCVSPPTYYLYWFERSYPNVPLNQDYGPFCIQCTNGIQEEKPTGLKWNQLLDAVVLFLKYKIITIYYAIYIKVFSYGTVSHLTFFTDDVLKLLMMRQNLLNSEDFFKKLLRLKSNKDLSLST